MLSAFLIGRVFVCPVRKEGIRSVTRTGLVRCRGVLCAFAIHSNLVWVGVFEFLQRNEVNGWSYSYCHDHNHERH